MKYPLLGPARGVGRGHRKPLGHLSLDEARELLKRGVIEPVRDPRTGLARFFIPCKRQAEIGRRAKVRPTCEHTVDEERHLTGVTYSPSHSILSEIAFVARRLGPAQPALRS